MNQYELISKVGEGTHGRVFKAKDKNGAILAIKHIKYQSNDQGIPATALREISLLKSIGLHPNIIKLLKVHYEAVESQLVVAFQYFDYDLKKFMKEKKEELSQAKIQNIMKQILVGVSLLHDRKIVHRDLKPQNIMIDSDGNVKIADFGLARYLTSKHKTLTIQVQSLWYRAPQIMLGMRNYNYSIDLWAVGCIFAELYLKRPLFITQQHEIQQIFKIFSILGTPSKQEWPSIENLPNYSVNFPKWKKQPLESIVKGMPKNALDLMEKFLCYDPDRRITAHQALNHPYITNFI